MSPYLSLGVLCRLLRCNGCALGLCQLQRFSFHLALRVAVLLLQVAHDHLFPCKSGLRGSSSGCCILRKVVLRLERSLPPCYMLVLDRCVRLVSCPLGNGYQAAAYTVPHTVVAVMSVACIRTSIAVILRSGLFVAEVVAILVF